MDEAKPSDPEGVGAGDSRAKRARPRSIGSNFFQQVASTAADVPRMGARLSFPNGSRPRAPRRPERPRTAFVLSGGGNQGVSQVGMRALQRDCFEEQRLVKGDGARGFCYTCHCF